MILFTLSCRNLCGFFSHFWPAAWHLWRFISALITPTCNLAAKHQLYIEFEISCTGWYERATSQCVTKLKGKNTCGRLVFVSNRSDAGKPFQMAPAHRLCILVKVGMSLTGHRYGLWKYACFWPLHTTSIIVSPRLSGRILSKNSLCASTVCLWHNIIYCALYYNAWQGRRKQEAKFQD